jgi:hypothetical protein
MFEKLFLYFVEKPHRLKAIAHLLVNTGGFLLLLGALGRVAKIGVGSMALLVGKAADVPMLASIYPSLPTWFIPEGAFGFALATTAVAVGAWVALLAKQLDRFCDA